MQAAAFFAREGRPDGELGHEHQVAQLDEIRGAVITYDGQKEFYTASGGPENTTAANPSGE